MAGGRFDKIVGKVRPGTYINFESGRENNVISTGKRGTVIIPLSKAVYGPAKQFIKLTNTNPDAEAAMLGYSIYDEILDKKNGRIIWDKDLAEDIWEDRLRLSKKLAKRRAF